MTPEQRFEEWWFRVPQPSPQEEHENIARTAFLAGYAQGQAALDPYVQHTKKCREPWDNPPAWWKCTCGLDAVLPAEAGGGMP